MIPLFYFLAIWFVGYKNNRNLNNFFQKLFIQDPPRSKVPISTRIISWNTIKRSWMFNQLIWAQNLQISIVFFLVKSISMKIKEWYHVSLTSKISAKSLSICSCFENVRTSRFQICPWFWWFTKIYRCNLAKQNIELLWELLYIKFEPWGM